MHLSPRLLSWVSAIGLVAVFGAFAGFELLDRVQSSQNVDNVRRADSVRAAYDDAKFAISATGASAANYIIQQTPQKRVQFDDSLVASRAALDHLGQVGDPEDRALATAMVAEYLPSLEVVQRYFQSLEDHETFSEPLPSANIVTDLTSRLEEAEAKQDARAEQAWRDYQAWRDTRLKVAGITLAAGLVLVLALVFASLIFGRRDALAQGELKHLRKVALLDSLTELGNRRAFEEHAALLAAPRPSDDSVIALAIIDVDEFKTINDTWGHERGDQLLRDLASALQACLPASATPFRIGGDEFAAILPGVGQDAAVAALDAFRCRVEAELAPATISIGIAVAAVSETDPTLLRQQADAALYEAKLRGRNLTILYHFSPESAPVFPAAKLQAVRHLLAEGAVRAVFQPIWTLSPRSVLGYEALARPDERYGLTGPQQAFDIAEQFGRVADLDRLCRQQALFAAASLPEGALLFVNVSPYTLTHASFSAEEMRAEFEAAGLRPSQVVLEITERSAVAPEVIGHAARQLRQVGFAIAIDDVGSGNNGIEMLRRVPFDYLKIDRSIIITAMDGGVGRPALMAILAFAHEARAQVLAEGVETEDSLRLVQQLARGPADPGGDLIQLVQGFLLGMPVSGFELPEERADEAA